MKPWVKLYRDERGAFAQLPLLARALAAEILKLTDDRGVIGLGRRTDDPAAAICFALGAERNERRAVKRLVGLLLDDGYLVHDEAEGVLLVRNFPRFQGTPTEPPRRSQSASTDTPTCAQGASTVHPHDAKSSESLESGPGDKEEEGDKDNSRTRTRDPAAAGDPAQEPDPQPPPLSPRKKLQADIEVRVRADSSSPGGAWQLLCELSELHCRSDGRPILIPGVMASPKDLATLERLYAAAEPIAVAEDVETLAILAEEWLALLALVEAGECEVKSRPLGFFASRFTRLREARDAYGAKNPPPRILEAVA